MCYRNEIMITEDIFDDEAINVIIRIHVNSKKEFDKNNKLWAINDGGDGAKLYQISVFPLPQKSQNVHLHF